MWYLSGDIYLFHARGRATWLCGIPRKISFWEKAPIDKETINHLARWDHTLVGQGRCDLELHHRRHISYSCFTLENPSLMSSMPFTLFKEAQTLFTHTWEETMKSQPNGRYMFTHSINQTKFKFCNSVPISQTLLWILSDIKFSFSSFNMQGRLSAYFKGTFPQHRSL